jgi:hypothetical protein
VRLIGSILPFFSAANLHEMETEMKRFWNSWEIVATIAILLLNASSGWSQEASTATAEVHLVITDAALRSDVEPPPLTKDDVKVKKGKEPLNVTQVIPAKGESGALELTILIDDTLDSSVGNSLTDIKNFVSAQPKGTVIAVAYMSNAGFKMAQNFTADRDLAVKALRLPRGTLSTMDSPYLSLIELVKAWPQHKVRREVVMVSDGIDRLRGVQPQLGGPGFGTVYHSMPTISSDADRASEMSQRYNVIVYPIYALGVGRAARSSWDLQIGLSGLTKIADETGGECFSLSISQAVSFQPYLERLQKLMENQYYIVFQAVPGKKAGFISVNVSTELPNSELLAPDNVWVSAGSE